MVIIPKMVQKYSESYFNQKFTADREMRRLIILLIKKLKPL